MWWASEYPLCICFIVSVLAVVLFRKTRNGFPGLLPPGPPAWPIIGNLFDLGTMPHQDLQNLRAKYGPVTWLKLGSVNTLVIQSPKAAAELFKNHDLNFSDRQVPHAVTALGYGQAILSFSDYGAYWRVLRRLYSAELLVKQRVIDSAPMRRKWIDNMIRWIEEEAAASLAKGLPGEIQLDRFLFLMAFNFIGNLMLSKDLLDLNAKEGDEFSQGMHNFMECAGKPNLADAVPCLQWLDPQRLKRQAERNLGRCLQVIKEFVKERIEDKQSAKENVKNDFLDKLLEYEGHGKEGPDKLSEENVNLIIMEMFFGGSETTSSTIEWAMAELLRSPDKMRKVKEELERVVGDNRKVEESDLDELPYLNAVIKETLRLHPAGPLLLPRKANQDTNFMGYTIPKNSQIIINAYAIQRDPDSWEDPKRFNPERFIGSNVEYKGQHYELIPFGAGRRICVGYMLAYRVMTLALASLLHSFEWKLDNNVTPEKMNMEERLGITLRKLIPLKAIPAKRNVPK